MAWNPGEKKSYTLYWSSLGVYEECPQKYLWSKGWGDIDVGGGPGRKKPIPTVDLNGKPIPRKSEHHAILGIAIQYAIERFYNDELWRSLDPETLKRRLLELANETFRFELARKYVDWRMAGDRVDLEKLVNDAVLGYMRTLKQHRLLGPYAKAEVELLGYVNKYTPVGGRADMIIRREDTGVTILDGKNSKRYKDPKTGLNTLTYTDPDQLRWYALLFYLTYQKLPDRLGFVYYRYPYGTPILDNEGLPTGTCEEGVDWVPFTRDDLKGLAARASDAMKGMDKKKFEPKPTPKTCKYCEYEGVCPERQTQKDGNRRGPRNADLFEASDGITTFSMSGGSKS